MGTCLSSTTAACASVAFVRCQMLWVSVALLQYLVIVCMATGLWCGEGGVSHIANGNVLGLHGLCAMCFSHPPPSLGLRPGVALGSSLVFLPLGGLPCAAAWLCNPWHPWVLGGALLGSALSHWWHCCLWGRGYTGCVLLGNTISGVTNCGQGTNHRA